MHIFWNIILYNILSLKSYYVNEKNLHFKLLICLKMELKLAKIKTFWELNFLILLIFCHLLNFGIREKSKIGPPYYRV